MRHATAVGALVVLTSCSPVWAAEGCPDAQKLPKEFASAESCRKAELDPLVRCLDQMKEQAGAAKLLKEIESLPGASSKERCKELEEFARKGLSLVRENGPAPTSASWSSKHSASEAPREGEARSQASLESAKKRAAKASNPFSGDFAPAAQVRDAVVASLPAARPGDRGHNVVVLQRRVDAVLEKHDVPPVKVDGVYGPKTSRAVASYEALVAAAAEKASSAYESTKNSLVHFVSDNFGGFGWFRPKDAAQSQGDSGAGLLQLKDKGEAVAILKDRLRTVPGIPKVGHTNEFDEGTVAAVKALQAKNHLEQTGVVDTKLWAILFADKPAAVPEAPLPAPVSGSDPARGSKDFKPAVAASGKATVPVVYRAVMNIDSDGAGGAWRNDKWQKGEAGRAGTVRGKPMTALSKRDGDGDQVYLDPRKIPYIVLPKSKKFEKAHGITLGDYVAIVRDDGRIAYGIFGDRGPAKGEASIRFAEDLGIDASVNSGGSAGEKLTYIIFPGSSKGFPGSEAEIRAEGERLYRQSRGL